MLLLPADFFLNKRFKKIYEEHHQAAAKPYESLSEPMPDPDLGPNCLQTGLQQTRKVAELIFYFWQRCFFCIPTAYHLMVNMYNRSLKLPITQR